MGQLIAGAILGALDVILVLVAIYYASKFRIAANLVKYYASEHGKLEQELKKAVGALQEAITPVTVKISDEQTFKMAQMINRAIEEMRKAELKGMN